MVPFIIFIFSTQGIKLNLKLIIKNATVYYRFVAANVVRVFFVCFLQSRARCRLSNKSFQKGCSRSVRLPLQTFDPVVDYYFFYVFGF